MSRIFPEFAYEPARIETCFWAQSVPETRLVTPRIEGDQSADIAIIGAGFTGLNAALHLAEDGVDCAILDAHFPGFGASGRNGGFCCLGGGQASSARLARRFGDSGRLDYRAAEKRAVEHVDALMTRHGIEADRHSRGETQLAHNARAFAAFSEERERVAAEYGLNAEILPQEALAEQGMKGGGFHGALTIPHGFGLDPRKYLLGLSEAVQEAGARIYSHSYVQRIEQSGTGHVLHTATGRLRCKRLIIATNGYSSEDLPPWMAARYMPAQSSVIVTRPLSEDDLAAQGWHSDQMSFDSRNLLHYFRLMPDRRFLFGMRGGLRSSPGADAAIRRLIRRDFEAMFPGWVQVETPHFWTGMVCFSASLLPFCGAIPEMPNAFAGFAYHGNGVAMGSYTGLILADLAQDKPPRLPLPEAMRSPPPRFPFGRLRRAVMWPAYMFKGLQDL